jgi:hypothetical protein
MFRNLLGRWLPHESLRFVLLVLRIENARFVSVTVVLKETVSRMVRKFLAECAKEQKQILRSPPPN